MSFNWKVKKWFKELVVTVMGNDSRVGLNSSNSLSPSTHPLLTQFSLALLQPCHTKQDVKM